jgi:2-keto-4-pentenoate hydratase/2-oxohepta-3-ene-1,7-dioic acid hydratase in catechol pathway
MRLLRVGDLGTEIPVVLDDTGQARDLRPVTSEIDGDFLAGGGLGYLRAGDTVELTIDRLGVQRQRIGQA